MLHQLPTFDAAKLATVFPDQTTADLRPMIEGSSIRTKEAKRRFVTVRNTRRAAEAIGRLPGDDEAVHLWLQANAFALFDVVPAMLDLAGRPADECILASLGIASRHVEALDVLFTTKRIKSATLVLSHYFSKVDKGEWSEAEAMFKRHGFAVGAARSHAKIIGLKFGHDHYIVESSGNLRSCKAAEVATITKNRALYRWHRAKILEMLGAN